MTMFKYLAAAAAIAGVSAPAAAQVAYGYPQSYPGTAYPQTYPGTAYPQTYPGTAYPQQYGYPGTAYGQQYGYPGQYGYGNQGTNVVEQVINQLLGNRYNVTDRTAISRCASAATVQAQSQYSGYGQGGYGQGGYGYNQNYAYGRNIAAPSFRVTAITDVQRRTGGLRVRGMMSSGYAGQYGGYQNQNYAAGDISFRCNVDYRGAVTNVKLSRNAAYRRY